MLTQVIMSNIPRHFRLEYYAIVWTEINTSVPGICSYGYVPLRHFGDILMRMETTATKCTKKNDGTIFALIRWHSLNENSRLLM